MVKARGRRAHNSASGWLLAAGLAVAPGCYAGIDASEQADTDQGEGDGDGVDDGADDGVDDGADSSGDDGSDDGVAAECDGESPPRAALLRMNRTTYVNALTDVFGSDVIAGVQVAIDAMPATHGGVFSSETTAPTYSEVAATVGIAAQLAYAMTLDADALAALEPCLASVPDGADPLTDVCVSDFIDTTARRMFRRPLTDDDRTRLAGDFAVGGEHSVSEGVATLLIALFIDPEFLYFTQTHGEEIADGVVALTPHETAAKLARVLWNSIPDEELLDAADAGLDDTALAAQVDRMLDDPRAHEAVSRFYYDWLELETLPFPSAMLFPEPEAQGQLRTAMETELLEFTRATTLDNDGTYADLLLDRTAVVDSPELASVYGVAMAADAQQLPADQRAGVLTRAGFLATNEINGSNAGHLIKRGARLSRMICRPLPLPDPENFPQDDPADPESNPDQGIRERFNIATAEPMCASCHVQLDGLGAPLGHYGGAGEWIDLETIETAEGGSNDLPIDTQSEVQLDGDPIEIGDGIALSEHLAASRVGARCMAQHLTRNIVARALEPGDTCMVDVATEVLAPETGEPQSIRQALVSLILSTHFRRATTQ